MTQRIRTGLVDGAGIQSGCCHAFALHQLPIAVDAQLTAVEIKPPQCKAQEFRF